MNNNKQNRLMNILEIEKNFIRHKEKISQIRKRDTIKQLKKSSHTQIDLINSFRKNWMSAQSVKQHNKSRQISFENQRLHQTLLKQYNRKKPRNDFSLQQTIRSPSQSRVEVASSRSKRKREKMIDDENHRLMQKILTIESTLSRDKIKSQHQKINQTRKRLQVYSAKNRQRMKQSLKKMNIEPVLYFPKKKTNRL